MTNVTLKGEPVRISGTLPAVGSRAPDFRLVGADLREVGLGDFAGRRKLLNIVPSLDTPTCAESTREFNRRAATVANAVILVISADLPFAQGRFCSTEGLTGVTPLSMMRSRDFAADYGVLIEEGPLAGITTRAVLVIDETDRVVYSELVPEITREPDYDNALTALAGE